MSGTLVKFGVVVVFLFSLSLLAQETKSPVTAPSEGKKEKQTDVKKKTVTDNSAYVVALANKGPKLAALIQASKGAKDGEPTAQLYHILDDDRGTSIEAWLVTQKILDSEAPVGRRILHLMIYLNVQTKDKDGKDLETPKVTDLDVAAARVVVEDL